MRATTIRTIGDLIDGRYRLAIYCEDQDCRHWAWADLQALAARLGRDHGSMRDDLVPKLRCSACRGKRRKGVSIRLHPDPTPHHLDVRKT
jgi:hypothetical protein